MGLSPDGRTVAAASYLQSRISLYEVATGKERASLAIELRSYPMMLAFSPDGRFLATHSNNSVRLWRLPVVRDSGQPRSVANLWDDLASADAGAAYQALGQFVWARKQALTLFQDKLRPVSVPPVDAMTAALRDLGSRNYPVRREATRLLEKFGEGAGPFLRKALRDSHTLEVRRRIEIILGKFADGSPQCLRHQRAIEVLETIGDNAACRFLEKLAAGAPESRLTQEARTALERLATRVKGP